MTAPSTIWNRIVTRVPWLNPLSPGLPECRHCTSTFGYKVSAEHQVRLTGTHRRGCRVPNEGDIDLTDLTGPMGEDA